MSWRDAEVLGRLRAAFDEHDLDATGSTTAMASRAALDGTTREGEGAGCELFELNVNGLIFRSDSYWRIVQPRPDPAHRADARGVSVEHPAPPTAARRSKRDPRTTAGAPSREGHP